jgi:hypothetical protein
MNMAFQGDDACNQDYWVHAAENITALTTTIGHEDALCA